MGEFAAGVHEGSDHAIVMYMSQVTHQLLIVGARTLAVSIDTLGGYTYVLGWTEQLTVLY